MALVGRVGFEVAGDLERGGLGLFVEDYSVWNMGDE